MMGGFLDLNLTSLRLRALTFIYILYILYIGFPWLFVVFFDTYLCIYCIYRFTSRFLILHHPLLFTPPSGVSLGTKYIAVYILAIWRRMRNTYRLYHMNSTRHQLNQYHEKPVDYIYIIIYISAHDYLLGTVSFLDTRFFLIVMMCLRRRGHSTLNQLCRNTTNLP